MYLVNIHTSGKYSGRRIVRSIKKINSLKTRVEFPDGKVVTVEKVELIKDLTIPPIEKK